VQAGFSYRKKAGRREYLRASIERGGVAAIARRFPRDGAGILSSIVQSQGFAILGEDSSDLSPGTMIGPDVVRILDAAHVRHAHLDIQLGCRAEFAAIAARQRESSQARRIRVLQAFNQIHRVP